MADRLKEKVIEFLRHDKSCPVGLLESFSLGDWQRLLPWLDASGLAIYFLKHLEDLDGTSVLPPLILLRLRQNRKDNRERSSRFLGEMGVIHRRFNASGVEFAVLKGYSLVPEYCFDPVLRHQCDLDYLVAEDDVHLAGDVLRVLGYSRVHSAPTSFTFTRRAGDLPRRKDIYKAGLNFSVELHTSVWDNNDVAKLEQLPDIWSRRQSNQVAGLVFPVLSAEDRFIHQCMHVLSHVLQFWLRLAWLYEIASFLQNVRTDLVFWRAVQDRVGEREYIRKTIHLVTLLAATMFGVEVPHTNCDYPALTLWGSHYGQQWAMHNLPGSKLSLFLFPDFMERSQWHDLQRQRLLPVHWPHSATQLNPSEPRRSWAARLAEYRYAGQRLAFHIREGWRYLREKPKWQRCLVASEEAARYERLSTVMQ